MLGFVELEGCIRFAQQYGDNAVIAGHVPDVARVAVDKHVSVSFVYSTFSRGG